jgi:hypothetical protein
MLLLPLNPLSISVAIFTHSAYYPNYMTKIIFVNEVYHKQAVFFILILKYAKRGIGDTSKEITNHKIFKL